MRRPAIRFPISIVPPVLLLFGAAPLAAGTHQLLTWTDNSADVDQCVTSTVLVTTITTIGDKGGNDATDVQLTLGGTAAATDLASIQVAYQTQTWVLSNPTLLTNTILLDNGAGQQKGGVDWTFTLVFNPIVGSKTFNLTVDNMGGTDNNPAVVGQTTTTRTVTGCVAGDTLSVSANSPIETADQVVGTAGIVMQRFQVDSDASGDGQVELSSLTLTDIGTAAPADIQTVRVYIDVDMVFTGSIEIGNAAFSADPTTVNLTLGTAADRTVTNGTPKYLFIVYDLAAGATPGRTFQSRVTDIQVAGGTDTGVSGQTLDSSLLTILEPPDNLSTSSPAAVETADQDAGTAGIVMQRFQVDSDTAGNGQIELSSVTVADVGTAVLTDIQTVRVYIDTDTVFAGSIEIGNAAFGTDPTTVNLALGTAADRTVANGTPKYLFIVYDLAAGATWGSTIRSQVTGVGVAPTDNGVTGLTYQSNPLTILEPPSTLSTSSPAAVETANRSAGTTGIVMQRFQVDSDAAGDGAVALTSVIVGDTGTVGTADIATARVYIDTDTGFTGSTEIGNAAFTTDPVTVILTLGTVADRTVTNGTPKYIFIVYDLAAGATPGLTFRSRITDVTVASPDNGVTGLTYPSNLLTVLEPPDTLVASGNTPIASANPNPGDTAIQMQVFQLDDLVAADGNDQIDLTSLTLEDIGTATTADIDTVYVYSDNNSGFGGATLIGQAAFSTDPITIALNLGDPVADRRVSNGSAKYIFIVYDLNAAATGGNTIQSRVTAVGATSPDSGVTGLTFDSNVLTIQGAAPADNLLTSNPAAVATVDPAVGTVGIVMQSFQVDSDTSGNSTVELASVAVTDLGTAVLADIDTVKVYIDTDNGFAGSTLVGSAAFSTDPVTVSLTLGDRTVTNGTSKWVFIVYDLNAAATLGNTIQSRVTDIGVTAPDNGVTGLTYDSSVLTIVATPSADQVQPGKPSAQAKGCLTVTVRAPFADDDNADSTVAIDRGDSSTGPFSVPICAGVGGATPRSCDDTAPTPGNTYYYQATFSDLDGVNGSATRVTDGVAVPTCEVGETDLTTVGSNSAVASSCGKITVTSGISGDSDGDGWTEVQYRTGVAPYTTACATLTGSGSRQCLIPGLAASTLYDVRIIHYETAPDTVTPDANGTPQDEQVDTTATTPACNGTDDDPPMILFLSPAWNAVLGGTDTLKLQIFDADVANVTVAWSVPGEAASGTATEVVGADQACGSDCAIFEFNLDTTLLGGDGTYYLQITATDSDGNQSVAARPFRVNNNGTQPAGGGLLLRRTHSSQLCVDCHDLPTHSSQSTSSKYGNWGIDCLTCHTPHKTTNIYLIRDEIRTPNSGLRPVALRTLSGVAEYGLAEDDNAANGLTSGVGICEVCHTRTKNADNSPRYRNSGGGAGGSHPTGLCTGCHTHDGGFAGAGSCDTCHNAPPTQGSHDQHTVAVTPTDYANTTFSSTVGEYGFACIKCHNGASHMLDTNDPHQVEVAGESTVPDTTAVGYVRDPFGAGIGSEQGPNTEFWEWDDGTCSNVYCHGNFTGGLNASYTWSVSTSACGDCHKATNADPPTAGSHTTHVSSTTYNFDCVTCHSDTASGGALLSLIIHVNGYVDWNLNEADPRITAASTYDGSHGGQTSTFATFGQCANVYCHSDGQASPTYTTPTWGASLDCRGCHGNDASSAPTMASGDHASHVNNAPQTLFGCADCHGATVSSSTTISTYANHVNGTPDVFVAATWDDNGGDGADNYAGGTCSGVYCHSNGSPITGGTVYQTPTWGVTTLDCIGCHGGDETTANRIGDTASPLEGSLTHEKHVNTYSFQCDDCHSDTVDTRASNTVLRTGQTTHIDQQPSIRFTTWPADQTGGTPNGAPNATHTCAGLYCHSDGQSTTAPFTAPLATPDWDNPTGGCATCHDNADPTSTTLSGAHFTHTETDGYAFGCERCHTDTVSSSTTISTVANHVNGVQDVFFDSSGVNNSGGSYDDVGEQCSNTYCHSDGTDFTPGYVSGPSIAWTTNSGCTSCHGASGSGAGDPGYANGTPKANSHNAHVVSAGYTCQTCHSTVVSAGASPTIISMGLHVNRVYNVVAGAGYSFTVTQPGSPGTPTTCGSNACHAPLSWGDTGLGCRDCHMDSQGTSTDEDIDDYTYGSTPTAVIDGEDWGSIGHGNTAGWASESNNPAPDFDNGGVRDGCLYCHSNSAESIGHGVSTNPFRLVNTGGADGKNGVCLKCHKSTETGYDGGLGGGNTITATVKIDAYHYGTDHAGKGGAGNDGGRFCWDCHDPHGDRDYSGGSPVTLAYMVQELPTRDHAGDVVATDWGVPSLSAPTPAFRRDRVTVGSWTWDDYVINTTFDGVCQVCHTQTANFFNGAGGYNSSHNPGQRCTAACHQHDQPPDAAFKGTGTCLGCHSSSGDAGTAGANSRRPVLPDFGKNSHHVGASLDDTGAALYSQPNMGGSLTNFDCVVCHAEGYVDTAPNPDEAKTCGALHGGDGGNTAINLRNVDDTDPTSCGGDGGTRYAYNKEAAGMPSKASPASWKSGNTEWENQTSAALDPFCVTCHDSDGAVSTFASNDSGTALNPFGDAKITNEYDQMVRTASGDPANGRVTDIASRVTSGGSDLESTLGGPRGNDGNFDPPEGVFSRHAIRGAAGAPSVYDTFNVAGSIPIGFFVSPWNDTSVMSCADCHTTDGANGTNGNAHGSSSEYLLKDASGLATEGSLTGSSYNCYLCHTITNYYETPHTSKSADWSDTTAVDGPANRTGSNGNIYGYACGNCHGGIVDTNDDGTGDYEYGTIHGTSQTMDVYGPFNKNYVQIATRKAYRFMNGNSLRYFQPDTQSTAGGPGSYTWNWETTTATCYTVSGADSFGGCSQHGSKSAAAVITKPAGARLLSY